jgi:cold shock CspA family protein
MSIVTVWREADTELQKGTPVEFTVTTRSGAQAAGVTLCEGGN